LDGEDFIEYGLGRVYVVTFETSNNIELAQYAIK
jgi:hypothetical protein